MRKVAILFLATSALFLASCSTSTGPSESYLDESQDQIFKRGEEAVSDRNYGEAVKRFEALQVQYPFGPHSETAQLHIIYAYYMKEEYPLAIAAADRFIRQYPADPHVDYAYYIRGLANYYQNLGIMERLFPVDLSRRDLASMKKAFADFSDLVHRYPNSPYAGSAYQYMIYLRNMLAMHQLEVAQYYYKRKAYIAAANRASDVVRHYQGAPSVPNALVIMAQSYRKLNMSQQLQDTMQVLQYNYPGYVDKARANSL